MYDSVIENIIVCCDSDNVIIDLYHSINLIDVNILSENNIEHIKMTYLLNPC